MIVWRMMRRVATTAQKTPAGWFGTVLPLGEEVSVIFKRE